MDRSYSKRFGAALRKVLDSRGIKYSYAAEQLGMSRQVLHAKMLGVNQWRLDEALTAVKAFKLPEDILLK